ncbi:MAG: AraC family transcriptional regulator [Devosia sp.]
MPNDPLTEIVKSLQLTGAVFLDADLTAPWAVVGQVTEEDVRPFMQVPRQVMAYHVITEGDALVFVDGQQHCVAKTGDVVFLPTNLPCVMASGSGLSPVMADDLLTPPGKDGLVHIRTGGGGARSRMLCGFIASNAGPNPLLNSLPDIAVIAIKDIATQRWIEASIAIAARELAAGRVAAGSVLARLVELLLIESLRSHLAHASQPRGWLAGMAEPRISRALARIHASLSSPPSVVELAEWAGMSRSAFVERFTATMGVGPRRYVLGQRIEAAGLLLHETTLSMAEVAHRVGYDAPEAFSRAFKRETGWSPAGWRALKGS